MYIPLQKNLSFYLDLCMNRGGVQVCGFISKIGKLPVFVFSDIIFKNLIVTETKIKKA